MKKCPFCAEEIQDDAVKCKHCGEFLIDAELKKYKNAKWYHRTPFVVISVLCFGPLALPLVWFNPRYGPATKVVVTIIIIAFTVALCYVSIEVYVKFLQQLEEMGV